MVERQPCWILAYKDESRATGILDSSKTPKDSLREACFPRTKIAGQKENIACLSMFAKQPSDVLGLFGAGGREDGGLLVF